MWRSCWLGRASWGFLIILVRFFKTFIEFLCMICSSLLPVWLLEFHFRSIAPVKWLCEALGGASERKNWSGEGPGLVGRWREQAALGGRFAAQLLITFQGRLLLAKTEKYCDRLFRIRRKDDLLSQSALKRSLSTLRLVHFECLITGARATILAEINYIETKIEVKFQPKIYGDPSCDFKMV